jgi:hypothetical protein
MGCDRRRLAEHGGKGYRQLKMAIALVGRIAEETVERHAIVALCVFDGIFCCSSSERAAIYKFAVPMRRAEGGNINLAKAAATGPKE